MKLAHLCCIARHIAFESDHKNVFNLMVQAEKLEFVLNGGGATIQQVIQILTDSLQAIKFVTTDIWSLKSLIHFDQNAQKVVGSIW